MASFPDFSDTWSVKRLWVVGLLWEFSEMVFVRDSVQVQVCRGAAGLSQLVLLLSSGGGGGSVAWRRHPSIQGGMVSAHVSDSLLILPLKTVSSVFGYKRTHS